jgi:uracil DNA glycosylase
MSRTQMLKVWAAQGILLLLATGLMALSLFA